jgi:hypothetical protein
MLTEITGDAVTDITADADFVVSAALTATTE